MENDNISNWYNIRKYKILWAQGNTRHIFGYTGKSVCKLLKWIKINSNKKYSRNIKAIKWINNNTRYNK